MGITDRIIDQAVDPELLSCMHPSDPLRKHLEAAIEKFRNGDGDSFNFMDDLRKFDIDHRVELDARTQVCNRVERWLAYHQPQIAEVAKRKGMSREVYMDNLLARLVEQLAKD
jgi:hypothetical protein